MHYVQIHFAKTMFSSELHSSKNLPYDTNIGLGGWVASDMLFK